MRAAVTALAVLVLLMHAAGVSAQRAPTGSGPGPTPSMSDAVYGRLSRAQACAEAGDWACARSALSQVGSLDALNGYERAKVWQFQGFIAYSQNDMPAVIEAYERVLLEHDLPRGLVNDVQYSLAQLYVSEERYDDALSRLDTWWPDSGPDTAEPYVLRSQIEYQRNDLAAGLAAIDAALALAEARGLEPDENSYRLKLAFHHALEDYDAVAATLEQLIERWPREEYYERLAGVQNVLGEPGSGLAAVDAGLGHAAEAGDAPSEDLYRMKASLHREREEWNEAASTLETMIRLWPEREYYEQLTVVTAQLGDETRTLQLLDTAYASGWLETSDALVAYARRLMAAGRTEAANRVLHQGLEQGTIEPDETTLELLEFAEHAR